MGGNLLGGCSTWGINDQIMSRAEEFPIHFSVIIFHFSNHEGIYTCRKSPDQNYKYLYLKLVVQRFQRFFHVQPDLDIFVKLTV